MDSQEGTPVIPAGGRALVYGCGFAGRVFARRLLARGWRVAGVSRSPERLSELAALGVASVDAAQGELVAQEAQAADAVLASAPPDAAGCPALRALSPVLQARRDAWTAYLSTTGVYGDRGGGWVDEDSELDARTPEAARRVAAEEGWRALHDRGGWALAVMRLPGIYGPGRSAFDRLREGRARRLDKPGQVFSRIHVDDLASALVAALARRAEGTFNVCDDRPSPAVDVLACAARLLSRAPPPADPFDADALAPGARRFWSESRRVSNARAKATLRWRPAYPGYAEGLTAVLRAERQAAD